MYVPWIQNQRVILCCCSLCVLISIFLCFFFFSSFHFFTDSNISEFNEEKNYIFIEYNFVSIRLHLIVWCGALTQTKQSNHSTKRIIFFWKFSLFFCWLNKPAKFTTIAPPNVQYCCRTHIYVTQCFIFSMIHTPKLCWMCCCCIQRAHINRISQSEWLLFYFWFFLQILHIWMWSWVCWVCVCSQSNKTKYKCSNIRPFRLNTSNSLKIQKNNLKI